MLGSARVAEAQRHEESCLSVDRAFELVMGRLAAHDAQRARAHAVQCAECLSLLGDVASRHEPSERRREASGTTPTALATGGVVGGRYRIAGRIGEGASCIVYRGVDDLPGRPIAVAIKVFRRSYLSRSSARERIEREREALGRLSSLRPRPTCELIAHGELAGCPFLVLELAERSLREELDRAEARALGARLGDAIQLASALAMVHEAGLVHADVKPANVLRTLDGRLVMSDFGLVEAADGAITHGVRRGTAMYMAPEHIRGAMPDAKSDLYALGLVLHELFFGARPEVNERAPTEHLLVAPPSPTRAEDAVFALCRACCAPDPWDRPASAREVAKRLARIAAREGLPASVPLPPRAYPRWQRALAIIALASSVAFAVGALGARALVGEAAVEAPSDAEPEPEHEHEPEPEPEARHEPEPEARREPEPEPTHAAALTAATAREPRAPIPTSAPVQPEPQRPEPQPTAPPPIVIDGGGTVDLWIAAYIPRRWSYCPALATRPLVRGAPPYRVAGLVGSFWAAADRSCLELAEGDTLVAYLDHAVDAVAIGRWRLVDGTLHIDIPATSTSLAGSWTGVLEGDRVTLVEATSHQAVEHRREVPSPARPTGGESARLIGFDSSRSGMGAVDLAAAYEPIRARVDACFAAATHVPEPHSEVDWRVRMDITGRVIDAWRLHGTGHDGHSLPTSVSHDRCVRDALLQMTIAPAAR